MAPTTKIQDLGWCQGSILPPELVKKLKEDIDFGELDSDSLFIVITQDCDLVSSSFEDEPFLEVLVAKKLQEENRDGNLTERKNPRRLQLTVEIETENIWYEISIHEKYRFSRKILEGFSPVTGKKLTSETIELLIDWVAWRYLRAAFPDKFNERCEPAKKELKRLLKRNGKLLTGIFVMLDGESGLDENSDYRIFVRVTTSPPSFDDMPTRRKLLQTVGEIEAALRTCQGIEVCDCQLSSEKDFSVDDLKYYKRWDFDYLSYRESPHGNIVPIVS